MESYKQWIGISLICDYVQRKTILEVTDGLPDVGVALTCWPHSPLLLLMEYARYLDLLTQRCYSCPWGRVCVCEKERLYLLCGAIKKVSVSGQALTIFIQFTFSFKKVQGKL